MAETTNKILAANIRNIRDAFGLSRKAFADKVMYPGFEENLKKYENGDYNPPEDLIDIISKISGITISELKTVPQHLNKREWDFDTSYDKYLETLNKEIDLNKLFIFYFDEEVSSDDNIKPIIKRLEHKNKMIKSINDIQKNFDVLEKYYIDTKDTNYIINILSYLLYEWVNLLDMFISENEISNFSRGKTMSFLNLTLEMGKILSNHKSQLEEAKSKFFNSFNDKVIFYLRKLRKSKFKEYVDYYISLRYIFGFNDLKLDSNDGVIFGMNLLETYELLGNKYAIALFDE